MDKTIGLDVENDLRKFSKSKSEMMLYKRFYVYKNLKNVFLE